jgi:hypothetical protein
MSDPTSSTRPDQVLADTKQLLAAIAAANKNPKVKNALAQLAAVQADIASIKVDPEWHWVVSQQEMGAYSKQISDIKAKIAANGGVASTLLTQQLQTATNNYATAAAWVQKVNDIIATKTKTVESLQSQIAKLQKLPLSNGNGGGSGGGSGGGGGSDSTTIKAPAGDPAAIEYQYNAPMVKSAYFHPFGPQAQTLTDSKFIADATALQNGRKAWDGITASKGVIQMSKVFAQSAPAPKSEKGKKSNLKDTTPYGFRFLYNPTNVSMAWGIVDAFSPEYMQSGQSQLSAVSIGLMKSTITFSLLLNRIGDMNFIADKDGNYAANVADLGVNAYDPYAYLQVRYPANGTPTTPVLPTLKPDSPYPGGDSVSIEERAEIWKRGTMYDLEYLFKAMGGYYSTYSSGLNGTTADRGWLQPIPLELHLGTGLRYLVRISSLDITHIQFNERMVPILTTVNVSCTRYYDSPDAWDNTVYSPDTVPTN